MATDERTLPERKAVKEALRAIGMSKRQVDAMLTAWPALVGATQAENDELHEKLAELQSRLQLSRDGVA
jgi:beta-xylosidase